MAGFDQGGLNRQVICGLFDALINGADAVPDFQSNIPEQTDQLLKAGTQFTIRLVRQQNKEIDVRSRPQFSPSITADCTQRYLVLQL